MNNQTAGTGDPYWHEWTIGQEMIIEMLDPDRAISSVTLQDPTIQGWDDVVVEYKSHIEFFQIKHTRVDESLSFSDLVSQDKRSNKSLLSHLAQSWDEVDYNPNNKFTIVTNRKATTKAIKNGKPPLNPFFKELKENLKKEKSLEQLITNDEWKKSYKDDFLSQLKGIGEKARDFLKQLEIKESQPDTPDLEKKIRFRLKEIFSITDEKVESIFALFDHALREWTTTRWEKTKVTVEDVWNKLSISETTTQVGDHHFAPPEPFFESRNQALSEITSGINDKTKKVIFLTGEPGIGKTSLVSKLNNKRERIIHLRYFTFRPISPENDLVPADASETAIGRSLWKDLLAQLREEFRGELAKFKVPIKTDFIATTEELRGHVIRLSIELAKKLETRIVIAIDGIDHAARAKLDQNNYLTSLLPPDNIPKEILFLIAGQPPQNYEKYPNWLKTDRSDIKKVVVPNLQKEDIKKLIAQTQVLENIDGVAELVQTRTGGNTLSVLYALKTISECKTVEEAITKLDQYKLKDGLSNYYENIWAHNVPADTWKFLPGELACIFSLSSAKLTNQDINFLLPSYGDVPDWNNIIRNLSPIIRTETDGASILYNDVRVFLTGIAASQESVMFERISGRLLELYLSENRFIRHRHIDLIRLLKKSKTEEKISKILNPKFIMESYVAGVPKSSVLEQCTFLAEHAVDKKSFELIVLVNCCFDTFSKIEQSLQEIDKSWETNEENGIVLDELRVLHHKQWNCEVLTIVLAEVLKLSRAGLTDRALGLYKRWFDSLDFESLLRYLPDHTKPSASKSGNEERFTDSFINCLRTAGKIVAHMPVKPFQGKMPNDTYQQALAYIHSGVLSEAQDIKSDLKWARAIRRAPGVYFPKDKVSAIGHYLDAGNLVRAVITLETLGTENVLEPEKNLCYLVSLLSGRESLTKKWRVSDSKSLIERVHEIDSSQYQTRDTYCAASAFILGWKDGSMDISAIAENISRSVGKGIREEEAPALKALLRDSAITGRWYSEIFDEGKSKDFISMTNNHLTALVARLLDFRAYFPTAFIHPESAITLILKSLLACCDRSDAEFHNELKKYLLQKFGSGWIVCTDRTVMFWSYLYRHGCVKQCEDLIEVSIGSNGEIWNWPFHEKFDAINALEKIELDWINKKLKKISEQLKWHSIGFSTHKEYSLYAEEAWFSEISKLDTNEWRTRGLNLLSLSERISKIADNRAGSGIAEEILLSALSVGPQDAYLAYRLLDDSEFGNWIVVKAITQHVSFGRLTEQELESHWLLSCGISRITDSYDCQRLVELQDTLKTRPGSISLDHFMATTTPLHNNLKSVFYVPEDREVEQSVSGDPRQIIREFRIETEDFKGIEYAIKKLIAEESPDLKAQVDEIFKKLLTYQLQYYWRYAGTQRIYSEIFRFLDSEQIWRLAKSITDSFKVSERTYFNSLSETLEYFSRYFAEGKIQLLQFGFDEFLKTHKDWLSGFSEEKCASLDRLQPYTALPSIPDTWDEFTTMVLLEPLNSRIANRIDSALVALTKMVTRKNVRICIAKLWSKLSEDQKEYLLFIFESLLTEYPNSISEIRVCLEESLRSNYLSLKLQAHLDFLAWQRVTGSDIPLPEFRASEILAKLDKLESPVQRIIDVGEGSRYLSSSHKLFQARISFFDTAFSKRTGAHISNRLSFLIDSQPVLGDEPEAKGQGGDFIISSRGSDDLFNTVIEHEISGGILKDKSLMRIFQCTSTITEANFFSHDFHPMKDPEKWDRIKGSKIDKRDVEALLNSDISPDLVVLSGSIRTYSEPSYLQVWYNTFFERDRDAFASRDWQSTFNGRSSFWHDNSTYWPDPTGTSFFAIGGGISKFTFRNRELVPSRTLFKKIGWNVDEHNPDAITCHGHKVAWLEKYVGPSPNLSSKQDRMSLMQRWVGEKVELQKAGILLGEGRIVTDLKIEVRHKDNH